MHMNCSTTLATALLGLQAGLLDEANHYFLLATCYEVIETNQVRGHLAGLWLNARVTPHVELSDEGLLLAVQLADCAPGRTNVFVPYAECWSLQLMRAQGTVLTDSLRFSGECTSLFADSPLVLDRAPVLQHPPASWGPLHR